MTLIKNKEYGLEVLDNAFACPHCSFMERRLLVLWLLLTMFLPSFAYDIDGIDDDPPTAKATLTYKNGDTYDVPWDGSSTLTENEVRREIGDASDPHYCDNITSAVIYNSVTHIGSSAFAGCSGLTSITIPNSTDYLGDCVFYGCTGLTSITIPSSFDSEWAHIGNQCFDKCTSLQSITCLATTPPPLEINWETNEYAQFTNTNDCPIYVPAASVNAYKSASGWSTYASRIKPMVKAILTYENGDVYEVPWDGQSSLSREEINRGITSSSSVYYCSKITRVVVNDNITSIGIGAFEDCTGLTIITIRATTPPSLEHSSVFYLNNTCPICVPIASVETYKEADGWSSFASRIYPAAKATLTYYNGDTYDVPWDGNTTLTNTELDRGITSKYDPHHVTNISRAIIYNGVETLGDYAFYDANNVMKLFEIDIPSTLQSFGYPTLTNCDQLTKVNIHDVASFCELEGVGGGKLFRTTQTGTRITSLYLDGEKVNDLVIPDGVTSIRSSCFAYCKDLISVDIPSTVTSIGGMAFHGCNELTSVNIHDIAAWCNIDMQYQLLDKNYFYSNPLTIAHNLYLNGEEIKDLVIPNSVASIGEFAFYGCDNLTGSLTIGNGVTSIGSYAFFGCDGLTTVTIPNSVTSIGRYAFRDCI